MSTQKTSKTSNGRRNQTTTSSTPQTAPEAPAPSVKVQFTNDAAANVYQKQIPQYATPGSSGFDLRSIETTTLTHLIPKVISTGLKFAIPEGYELQIRSRSGLAAQGLVVTNSPGTVDSDYRGEVKIILHCYPTKTHIQAGEKVAQAVLVPVAQLPLERGDVEVDTERGEGGLGSTGR